MMILASCEGLVIVEKPPSVPQKQPYNHTKNHKNACL